MGEKKDNTNIAIEGLSENYLSEDIEDFSLLEIDSKKEKALVRKFDRKLMPMFAVVYFLSFLDRANIGNAKIAGMYEQLNLTDSQYSLSVSIFYVTYILCEIPSVLMFKKLGPHRFLCAVICCWSLITIFTAFVRNYWSLVLCRLLLGIEGAYFPAVLLMLSMIYKRQEQTRRLSYLYVCSCFSGAFGGLIATGITNIKPTGIMDSWSWLYIIEGCISFFAAWWVFFCLPDDPANAKFLDDEEKKIMHIREEQRKQYMGDPKFDKKEFFAALKDPKLFISCTIQFCVDLVLYGYSTFLPSILKLQLGYDSMQAQYMSVPVYAVAAISVYSFSVLADKKNVKSHIIFGVNMVGMIGYIILLSSTSAAVNYFATYLIAIPLYTAVALNITWLNNNMAPHYRRATALGFNQTFGNLAGVVAGQVYRSPPYKLGNGFSLGCSVVSMIFTSLMYIYLKAQNKEKESIMNGDKEDKKVNRSGCSELDFVYVY